jgi:hypothetical protein
MSSYCSDPHSNSHSRSERDLLVNLDNSYRSFSVSSPSNTPHHALALPHRMFNWIEMDQIFAAVNAKEDQVNTPRANAEPEISEPEAPRKDFRRKLVAEDQGRMLQLNDETADFAVICEDQRFMAHKSVLAAACPYFERMFRFEGKVSHLVLCIVPPLRGESDILSRNARSNGLFRGR